MTSRLPILDPILVSMQQDKEEGEGKRMVRKGGHRPHQTTGRWFEAGPGAVGKPIPVPPPPHSPTQAHTPRAPPPPPPTHTPSAGV